jgi:hypothetical protein
MRSRISLSREFGVGKMNCSPKLKEIGVEVITGLEILCELEILSAK